MQAVGENQSLRNIGGVAELVKVLFVRFHNAQLANIRL